MEDHQGLRFLLRDKEFVKFLSGRLVSEVGSRITREGLPLAAILLLAARAPELALLAALSALPALLLSPLVGGWVDRVKRRPILIGADIIRFLLLSAIPLAALFHELTFWLVAAVTFTVAALTVAFNVADQAYLPSFAGRDRLEEANGLAAVASDIGETGGPALMGILFQWLGAPAAIFSDALSYLASAASLLSIRKEEPAPQPSTHRPQPLREAWAGLRWLLTHPVLRPLAATNATAAFFGGFFETLYELYVVKTLGFSPFILGLLVTLGGVGALIGALLSRRLVARFGIGPVLTVGYLGWAVTTFLVPVAGGGFLSSLLFLLGAQFLGDMAGTVFNINEAVIRQGVTPDAFLGRVSAAAAFLVGALGVVGTLVSGGLVGVVGIHGAFYISALGNVLAAAWLLLSGVWRLRGPVEVHWDHFGLALRSDGGT